jgi:Na+-transporting NADH:ubiquinone oxidoreductase subunit F
MILFRKLHKWIGLAIGIQVAIWMISGFMMGLLDHNRVQGIHNKTATTAAARISRRQVLAEPAQVLSQFSADAAVRRIDLLTVLGSPMYRVDAADGQTLFDATTGRSFDVTETVARRIAQSDYSGSGEISAVTSMQAPAMEVRRHAGDVWRVDFDDDDATSLYISKGDGEILERRNDTWRLFDVFWMLHIMDYQGRESFNNALAIIASLIAAWFAITGVVLLFGSFRKEDFLGLLPGGWGRKSAEISVCAPHGEILARIDSYAGGRLYDELAKGDIVLPSNCGGGGTCGLCAVSLAPDAVETPADIRVIPEHARRQGVRLSCQAEVIDNMSVGISDKVLSAELHRAEVVDSRSITPSIREITLKVLDGELSYHAGSYTHVLIPPHKLIVSDLDLTDDAHTSLRHSSSSFVSHNETEIRRAYSLANVPQDNINEIVLNVRFMPPPKDASDAYAGAGSSYMWSLRKGDVVNLVGPLGDFKATNTDLDMIFVGGGAGMAPLRSIIRYELLHSGSGRKIDFWYGGRTGKDLLYADDFDQLAAKFANFNWQPVLSEPQDIDNWTGPTGFVHDTVRETLLARKQDFSSCEFYICGPPAMLAATRQMIAEFGVPETRVFFDDFGI